MSLLAEAAITFLAGCGVCLLLGSLATRWLVRARLVQPVRYEDCPPLQSYQQAKQETPTMGGLFVLISGITVAALAGGLNRREGWIILAVVIGMAGVGLLDDILKLRSKNATGLRSLPKLIVALIVGAVLGMALSSGGSEYRILYIPWLARSIDLGWLWLPFAMLVMAGCAHAVNLTDGLDGLAPGCVAIALVFLGIWAMQGVAQGSVLIPWCAALAGACVGFLWFNGFPASVYLGDVGALGLGSALAAVSLMTHTALWLVVIGGVFVAEAMSVIIQVASYKLRARQRIFRVAPLHHHFQLGGISEPKLIVRFWIAALMLGLVGLTAIRLP